MLRTLSILWRLRLVNQLAKETSRKGRCENIKGCKSTKGEKNAIHKDAQKGEKVRIALTRFAEICII